MTAPPINYRPNFTKGRTPAERFWEKVAKTDECWLWIGATNTGGYGSFWDGAHKRRIVASRFAWELEYGEPPPKHLYVCHRCDTPLCVRPSHLFLGTGSDNMQDALRKGRFHGTRQYPKGSRHPNAKLNEPLVRELRRRYQAGEKIRAMARELGLTEWPVRAAVTGKAWRHVDGAALAPFVEET